jgi:hypothetical protein
MSEPTAWILARLHFLSRECDRLGADRVARFFLKRARQSVRSADDRLRVRAWHALDVVADQLVGRVERSAEEPQSKKDLVEDAQ